MAGTNRTRGQGGATPAGPVIVLVRPQLGENIGTAARAMLNCGLTELRLVAPRDGWPNERARAAASGADGVIDAAKLFDDVPSAVADLNRVFATTARSRDMVHRLITPDRAAAEFGEAISQGQRCGILFGPERSGLTNDDLSYVEAIVTVPLNPSYSSLNLAQAVLLVSYQFARLRYEAEAQQRISSHPKLAASKPASKQELTALFEHLERELDEVGFMRVKEKRPVMVRNIRSVLQRAEMTKQEVQTFHGIIKELGRNRYKPKGS